ncbi:MAG: cyclic nucleotide-binding domain-containing protein [Deltaproteobacteria bacterium]|nr:cyclic nucleotide-binding domain-containing protein [Deltaproteobacteria bacterium]
MDNLEQSLAAHPFLAGLTSQQLQLLAECASLVNFRANQVIFAEGEEVKALYLLRFGRVAVEVHRTRRGPKTIYTLGEGDFLGLFWSGEEGKWFFDARAMELTRAIALNFDCLRRVLDNNPDLGYELLKRFVRMQAQKIKILKLQLVDFYGS